MNFGYVLACDVCGAPVTSIAQDVYVKDSWRSAAFEFTPVGHWKMGCDEHPAKSEQIEIGMELPAITSW